MTGPRPAKRRKEYDEPLIEDIPWRMLSIRLCQAVSETLGLASTVFLKVENVDFITFNESKCSYLYFLCSLLFSVRQKDMTLYNSRLDRRLDDDDTSWEACENGDNIQHGQYLLVFENGTVPSLEPIPVKETRQGKAKNQPGADEDVFASPTPTKPSTIGLRSSPSKPLTNQSPAPSTSSTSSSPRSDRDQDQRIRSAVVVRDNRCVVTNVSSEMAQCSHIIPRHLLKKQSIVYDNIEFASPSDPTICLLLSFGIDRIIDRFMGGIRYQAGSYRFEIFQRAGRCGEDAFPMDAWVSACSKWPCRIPEYPTLRVALRWHYRQSMMKNWCSDEIAQRTFDLSDEEAFAWEHFSLGACPYPHADCLDSSDDEFTRAV